MSLQLDPTTEGMWTPERLPGSFTFTPTYTAATCYFLNGDLVVGGAIAGVLTPGMYVRGAGLAPGTIIGSQNADGTWNISAQQQILPTLTSFSVQAGVKLLPFVTNLKNGTLAYCTDIPGYVFWDSIAQLWKQFGSGGASAGPNNTPGFGALTMATGVPSGTTLTDYVPSGTGTWSSLTSELSMAPTALTDLNSLDATGRAEGSTLAIDNDGSATIRVNPLAAGSAANQFQTSNSAIIGIPPGGSLLFRRHNAKWRVQ